MKYSNSMHRNQSGLVSFFVVVIIMIVLSLIVLAFAQLVRREQRQTLDRQLSTQAFYAAESGVNDAIDALPALLAANTPWAEDDCDSFIDAAGLEPDLGNGVSYSCLLVDRAPAVLNYSSVPTDESIATSLEAEGGAPITSIEISWDDPATGSVSSCPQGGNSFPGGLQGPYAGCDVGALRVELVPFGGSRTRNQLISDRFIGFIQPRPGGIISLPFATGSGDQQGVKRVGGCNEAAAAPRCTLRVTGLGSFNSNLFYLRIRSLYRPTTVAIRAFTGSSTPVNLIGAQVEVDVTGKASDVLRRIKVNRPIDIAGDPSPEFALQTADTLCKRFSIAPAPPGGSDLLEWYEGSGATDGECNPSN